MPAVNGGRSGDVGKVIVGNGPLFDFGMGVSSINTKLRPIALTYMVTKLSARLFDQPAPLSKNLLNILNAPHLISCGLQLTTKRPEPLHPT